MQFRLTDDNALDESKWLTDDNPFVRLGSGVVNDQLVIAYCFCDRLDNRVPAGRHPVRIGKGTDRNRLFLAKIYSRSGRTGVLFGAVVCRCAIAAVVGNALILRVDTFSLSERSTAGNDENE